MGPNLQLIDSWIAIHADNTATALIGFVEQGQGCTTSLPQIAAEELDLGADQMRIVAHETDVTPYQGGTYSSSAIANGRPQVQDAAAEARLELFKRAATHLNVSVDMLEVTRGVVSVKDAPTRSVTYGELVGDRQFETSFTGEAKPKPTSSYKIIGQPVKRKDMAGKITGDHTYIQHMRLPDMLHARIIQPRGHSLYDDCAIAAVLISREIGAPVRVQYGREDEHGWDTYGLAHVGQVKVSAGQDGTLSGYSYDGWHHSWSFTEANDQLARGTPAAVWPMGASRGVNPAVCGGIYAIGNVKLVDHALPGEAYFRSAWLRSPLDLSFAFTSEQAIDDLAYQTGMDPVAFRRKNIADHRWQGVLDAAAKAANWQEDIAQTQRQKGDIVSGRGVGLGTHLAGWGGAVADIEVNRETGVVRVKRLFGALDAGCTINPNIVEAQITGQLVQTVSRMLFEEVTFDKKAVTSLDWNSYPIAGFVDCPNITPIIVQRIDEPSTGAGEEVMAAAAAIANAFFDATGRRMATFLFSRERVKAAIS